MPRGLPLSLIVLLASLCAAAPSCGEKKAEPAPPDPLALVNPFIGSGGRYFGFGSAFVGACVPHGMAKPAPDTGTVHGAAAFHHFSGYHAEDDMVHGFSQVHIHGTGAVDYGALLIMPTSGFAEGKITETAYRSQFSKDTETASPGYYAVTLADYDIRAELTAAAHSAVYRFSWAEAEADPVLIVDPSHALPDCEVLASETHLSPAGDAVWGWVHYAGALTGRSGGFVLHYQMEFSRAPASWTGWQAGAYGDGLTDLVGGAERAGAALRFAPSADPLLVRVGLSYVDLDGARANLAAEVPDFDFDAVHEKARAAWLADLSRIEIVGGTEREQTIFYTSLYHVLLSPTLFMDLDGRYLGFDQQIHSATGFSYYTDFSMWDTYRTVHPLLTLVYPERQLDMIESLLSMYRQGGVLPKWPAAAGYTGCMIGTPADMVIADSYLKGLTAFDAEEALVAMKKGATEPQPEAGRAAVLRYLELGYVPADEVGGAAARTMEYGVADAAIANLARALGHTDDAAEFEARSSGYRHLWDAELQFMRGKNADGSWNVDDGPFNELDWNASYYTEGTAWQYIWLVPQDPQGLIDLFGSEQAMADKLEAFFSTPEPDDPLMEMLPKLYYWQGNEPDIHAAYLFDDLGQPDRAQHWVRQIMATIYGDGPDGVPGNDDLGTMGAWFVFSAAGFYPSAGQTWYWVGSPLFERITFHLAGGADLVVRAPGASAENRYIQRARLNGQDLDRPRFDHADIGAGGELLLELGPEPSAWGR